MRFAAVCSLFFTPVSAFVIACGEPVSPAFAAAAAGVFDSIEGFKPLGPPTLEQLNALFPEEAVKRAPVRGQRPSKEGGNASDLLIQMLQSPDASIRVRAVEGLTGDAAVQAAPLLLIALADDEIDVRNAADRAIATVPGDSLAESIIGVLGWGDPVVAKAVDAQLPALRNTLEEPMLKRFESKETPRIERMAAAYCLGRIGCSRAGPALAGEVWGNDLALALYCATALTEIDNPDLLDDYVHMAAHPHVQMRVAAYRGLARIGGDDARHTLMEAASGRAEADTSARKVAIRLLAFVPNDDVVQFLMDQVRAAAGLVRPATDALAAMFGLPVGLERERWLEWYQEVYQPANAKRTPTPSARASTSPESGVPIGFPENGFPFDP